MFTRLILENIPGFEGVSDRDSTLMDSEERDLREFEVHVWDQRAQLDWELLRMK